MRISSIARQLAAPFLIATIGGGLLTAAPAQAATYDSTATATIPTFSASNQVATVTGKVTPCPAGGRPVSVNIVDSAGGSATWKAGGTTNADCSYSISFPTDYVRYYRVYAGPKTVGADTYKAANSPNFSQIKSLHFWEPFAYANVGALQASGKWSLRGDQYRTADAWGSGRYHNRSSWDSMSMVNDGYDGGAVQFNLVREDLSPVDGKPRYKSPQITAGYLPDVPYGHLEASVKFQRPKGATGAVWWRNAGEPYGEIDVAEFFGRESSGDNFIQSTLHLANENSTCVRAWTSTANNNIGNACTNKLSPKQNMGATDTWWNQYHTYEATWTAGKIVFEIDGVIIGTIVDNTATNTAVPAAVAETILSLQVSDGGQYTALERHLAGTDYDPQSTRSLADYSMRVDWVRVWR